MVVTLSDPSGLAQGIQTAGSALAQALERRGTQRLQQRNRGALGTALEQADLTTPEGQQGFLRKTLEANVPVEDALGILDRAIKQQQATQKQGFRPRDKEGFENALIEFGESPEDARSFANIDEFLSEGGRSEFDRVLMDRKQRRGTNEPGKRAVEDLDGIKGIKAPGSDVKPEEGIKPEEKEFEFPEVDMFEGLTPKEKVGREKELFSANSKEYITIANKIKGLKDEAISVNQLEVYNESGKLPKNFERLNVDWDTGKIRFPALANAETQGFVKTVHDFTTKIKETYGGSKITNFEIEIFMKRLPSLANSEEGRRLIIKQMKAFNAYATLYHDSKKQVYDKYGLRNIDAQKAETIADALRAPKEPGLLRDITDAARSQEVIGLKSKLKKNEVLMEVKGQRGSVPRDQVERALEGGGRLL